MEKEAKTLANNHVAWQLKLLEPLLKTYFEHGFKHGYEYALELDQQNNSYIKACKTLAKSLQEDIL